ncbi:MAG TPA: DUF3108 domain-containing protein [Gammaproteobacteria bacterium]|nr:DUF3108 domain-containing protein [Gammaproteobacteria bacterium]
MIPRPGHWLAGGLLLLSAWAPSIAHAGAEEPYPAFRAEYEVRVNGIRAGRSEVSLQALDNGEYLYRQASESTGIASLFGKQTAEQRSRWVLVNGRPRPLEFVSRREKGDDDDNAHLRFDWCARRVRNVGAGEHWDIPMPEYSLDSLLMQLAILFDLRDGLRNLSYPVATRGRIKTYRFKVEGREVLKLPLGEFDTLRLRRTDDARDVSLIWSAPALDYFPVRFEKRKKSGLRTELRLRTLEFRR